MVDAGWINNKYLHVDGGYFYEWVNDGKTRGASPFLSSLLFAHAGFRFAVQIGSFEGGSALWFAEHLLKHPESSMVCVDTWEGSPEIGEPDMHSVEVSGRLGQLLSKLPFSASLLTTTYDYRFGILPVLRPPRDRHSFYGRDLPKRRSLSPWHQQGRSTFEQQKFFACPAHRVTQNCTNVRV